MTERGRFPAVLLATPVIAIVRSAAPQNLDGVCDTVIEHGIRQLEITTNTPGWQVTVERLASAADAEIGVGTVTTVEQVIEAASIGAAFVVAPDTNPAVGGAAAEHGLDWYPGALTPTEIVTAWNAGATAVKVFPAGATGGAEYVRALRAPLPHIPLVPTGGIALHEVPDYFRAGVAALGIGSPLIGDALSGGSPNELAARVRRVVELSHA